MEEKIQKASVILVILPGDIKALPVTQMSDYLEYRNIKIVSTPEMINVSSDGRRYIVAFWDDDIAEVDPKILAANITSVFMDNLRGYEINLEMSYRRNTRLDISDRPLNVINAVLRLHNEFATNFRELRNEESAFVYTTSSIIEQVYKEYASRIEAEADVPDAPDEEDYIMKFMMNGKLSGNTDDESEDDGDEDVDLMTMLGLSDDSSKGSKKKKKSSKKISYGASRALRATNNPKKAYKRHGVLVCAKKDAIKRDEKIIKEFLKDFIPGSAEWKKEFRKELLKRWMGVYVISKKKLKHLEKNYRNKAVQKRRNANVERTLSLTRQLFNVPADQWNNPNR